jgi:hypothetical protein
MKQDKLSDIFDRELGWHPMLNKYGKLMFSDRARSELHIAEHFYSQTALADLLGIPAHAIYDNRLYRALNKALAQKDQLQKHLKQRLGELFQISYDLFLYDVTSTLRA